MDKKQFIQLSGGTEVNPDVMPEMELLAISGGVWACEDAADSPGVVLRRWRVYEVKLPRREMRTRHIVGYDNVLREGRVSSAVKSIDAAKMRGITESGHIYELQGPQGPRRGWGDADYVWSRWKQLSGATDVADVTEELLK